MDYRQALIALESLHHAYAIEGAEGARELLLSHLATLGCALGSPDFFLYTHEQFGINESRELTRLASRKPLVLARSVCVVTAPSFTIEAQQALLKTFEDPQARISFFIITPSVATLLPTLRSRLATLALQQSEAKEDDAAAFLAANHKERMKQLEPLIKERNTGAIIAFLASLERCLAQRAGEENARRGLKALYRTRAYITDKGALIKSLLEQVALLTPVR